MVEKPTLKIREASNLPAKGLFAIPLFIINILTEEKPTTGDQELSN